VTLCVLPLKIAKDMHSEVDWARAVNKKVDAGTAAPTLRTYASLPELPEKMHRVRFAVLKHPTNQIALCRCELAVFW
jgi:hypothetical protein